MDETKNDAAADSQPGGGALVAARNQTMALAFSGLVPQSIGEAMTLCTALAKSLAIPKGLRGKPESILTVVMAGLELGLTPIRAIQSITNISGNLCMKADLQLALVRRSGLLVYFDEGYEEAGRTDHEGRLLKKLKANRCPFPEDTADLILELTADLPDDRPYGWTVAKRKGDDQLITRVFSWADAERAFVYEQDEDEAGSSERKRKKLSEKFNYVAWPQSMYPRRSRGQVLQTGFSDVLAGMPSLEALEGGQVIDVDRADYSVGTDADDLLADMRNQDAEAASGIELAFQNLNVAPGRQLQLLTKFKGDPKALWLHLRDEYSRRQGKVAAPPPKAKTGEAKAVDGQVVTEPAKPEPAKPAPQAPAPVQEQAPAQAAAGEALFRVGFEAPDGSTTPPAQTAAAPVQQQPEAPKPAADQAPAGKKPTVSELAARFKSGMPSF